MLDVSEYPLSSASFEKFSVPVTLMPLSNVVLPTKVIRVNLPFEKPEKLVSP